MTMNFVQDATEFVNEILNRDERVDARNVAAVLTTLPFLQELQGEFRRSPDARFGDALLVALSLLRDAHPPAMREFEHEGARFFAEYTKKRDAMLDAAERNRVASVVSAQDSSSATDPVDVDYTWYALAHCRAIRDATDALQRAMPSAAPSRAHDLASMIADAVTELAAIVEDERHAGLRAARERDS